MEQKLNMLYRRKIINKWKLVYYLIFLGSCIFLIVYITWRPSKNVSLKWFHQNQNASNLLERVSFKEKIPNCKKEHETLIGIVSSPANRENRDAIRQSWGKNLPLNWKIIYFLGDSMDTYLQNLVKEESKLYGDVVQGTFKESYQNLTLKVLSMFKWTMQYCQHATFILKIDDDVYLNREMMKNLLRCLNLALLKSYPSDFNLCYSWDLKDIVGHYLSNNGNYVPYVAGGFLYKDINPDRNPNSKWYIDNRLYPHKVIPHSLSGTSYLLSANLIPLIIAKSKNHPLINLEDVYITGIILDRDLNIKLSHINGWNNFRPRWDNPCFYKTILTSHGLKSHELVSLTTQINNLKNNSCGYLEAIKGKINYYASKYFPRISI